MPLRGRLSPDRSDTLRSHQRPAVLITGGPPARTTPPRTTAPASGPTRRLRGATMRCRVRCGHRAVPNVVPRPVVARRPCRRTAANDPSPKGQARQPKRHPRRARRHVRRVRRHVRRVRRHVRRVRRHPRRVRCQARRVRRRVGRARRQARRARRQVGRASWRSGAHSADAGDVSAGWATSAQTGGDATEWWRVEELAGGVVGARWGGR